MPQCWLWRRQISAAAAMWVRAALRWYALRSDFVIKRSADLGSGAAGEGQLWPWSNGVGRVGAGLRTSGGFQVSEQGRCLVRWVSRGQRLQPSVDQPGVILYISQRASLAQASLLMKEIQTGGDRHCLLDLGAHVHGMPVF